MADVVMILLVFVFTAVTLLWVAACDHLLQTDSTREGPEAEHAGAAWASAKTVEHTAARKTGAHA